MKGISNKIDAKIRQKIKRLVTTEEKLNKYQMQLTGIQEKIKTLQQNRLSFVKALKDFDNNRTRQTLENLYHYFAADDFFAKEKLTKLQQAYDFIVSIQEQSAECHEELAQLLSAQTIISGYVNSIHKVFYDFKIVYFQREMRNQIHPDAMYSRIHGEISAFVHEGEQLLDTIKNMKPMQNISHVKNLQFFWKYYKRGKLILHGIEKNIQLLQKKIRSLEDTDNYLSASDEIEEILIELDELYLDRVYEYQSVLFDLRKQSIQETTSKNNLCVEIHGLLQMKNTWQQFISPNLKTEFLCLEVLEDAPLQELILNLEVLLLHTKLAFIVTEDARLQEKIEEAVKKIVHEEKLSLYYFCKQKGKSPCVLPSSWMDSVNVLELLEKCSPEEKEKTTAFIKALNKPISREQDAKEIFSYTIGLINVSRYIGDSDSALLDYAIQCILEGNDTALYAMAGVLAENQCGSEILYLIIQSLSANRTFAGKIQKLLEKICFFDNDLYQELSRKDEESLNIAVLESISDSGIRQYY